jgi:pSer/pThr/pTyr-binding forkhead associated (FHA) protein
MSELTLTAIRLGFLAVLWLFILTAISVMRADLSGTRTGQRAPAEARPARPPKPSKSRRHAPSKLVVTEGALAGTAVRLGGAPVTIGRAPDSTLVLTDDYVSTRHARLFADDGQWLVEDAGSTNGTYLDRSKVQRATPVPIGTPIRIGKTVLELRK